METIDTHTHVISKDTAKYPTNMEETSHWEESGGVDAQQLLHSLAGAGVHKAIIVQPKSAYAYDNSYAADTCNQFQGRLISVGSVDTASSEAGRKIRYWVNDRGMRGIRVVALAGSKAFTLSAVTDTVWETLDELGVPVLVPLNRRDIDAVHQLAERFPKLQLVLDHRSFIAGKDSAAYRQRPSSLDLSLSPNVYAKFSTHLIDACNDAGVEFQEYFSPVVEAFGANRLMWGSDYPAIHDRSYVQLVDEARRAISGFSAADQQLLMGGTAARLWPELSEPVAAAV